MNADELKTLTKMYIKDVGLYYPEKIVEMKAEKKRIGVRKFKMDEYLPFIEWYRNNYTIEAVMVNQRGSVYRNEHYQLSMEEALKYKDLIITTGAFPNSTFKQVDIHKVLEVTISQKNFITEESTIIEKTIIDPAPYTLWKPYNPV